MNIKKILIWLAVGLILFGAGFYVGGLMKSPSSGGVLGVLQTSGGIQQLNSKVISSIVAYGSVVKVNGNSVTINSQGDTMAIAIRTDAKIYSFLSDNSAKPAGASKQITLAEVKSGDNVSVNLKVLSSGQLEGVSLVVLPPSPAVK